VGGQEDISLSDSMATPHSLADAIREKLLVDDDSDQAILGTCCVFLLICSFKSLTSLVPYQNGHFR
jgi:hypothetical protein